MSKLEWYAFRIASMLEGLENYERQLVLADALDGFCVHRKGCYRKLKENEACYCERDD